MTKPHIVPRPTRQDVAQRLTLHDGFVERLRELENEKNLAPTMSARKRSLPVLAI